MGIVAKSGSRLSDDRAPNVVELNYSRRNRVDLRISSREFTLEFISLLSEYREFRAKNGQRQIKKDGPAYFIHLHIIVADLYAAWLGDPDIYVGYSRGKQNFLRGGAYWDFQNDQALLSERIYLTLIDFLTEHGYIENHIAAIGRNPYSSRMRAKPKLIELLQERKVNWASIRVDTSQSAIIVKGENKKIIPLPDDSSFDLEQAEANLRRINENLQTSLINLNVTDEEHAAIRAQIRPGVDDEQEPHELETQREPLEFSNRSLKRIFAKGSFDYGGRFYGGWWQGVPSIYREFIVIEGCITVEMDFSTIQPRILYAVADAEPPEAAYAVPGWGVDLRPVIKKAFNQLVNGSEGSRPERQWHRFAPDMDPDPLPKGWASMKKHQRAIVQRKEFEKRTGREYVELLHDLKAMHEPIDPFFFSQAWTWLQRRDSDIAEKVMLKLLDQAYTALPIHDSFIVRRDAEGRLLEAMNEAFEEVIGVAVEVDREATVYDGHSGGGIVDLFELVEPFRADLFERSGYYGRFAEWQRTWGPRGYE